MVHTSTPSNRRTTQKTAVREVVGGRAASTFQRGKCRARANPSRAHTQGEKGSSLTSHSCVMLPVGVWPRTRCISMVGEGSGPTPYSYASEANV
eukprot:365455-Chlamydomonas_euryale.AAC.17